MSLRLSRPLRLLLLGAPGSGKGTQTSKLLQQVQLPTISSGDLLRQQISLNPSLKKTISRGELIPDDTMAGIVVGELYSRELLQRQKTWLLDGFPRTLNQAELLDIELGKHASNLNFVVELNVPQHVILERIENRWVHIPSGRIYNLQYNPPKVAGKDDVTGEPLDKRPDDNVEVFQRRLDQYNETIEPLKKFYSSRNVFYSVDGETSDIIFPKLLQLINRHFS
jgi:adenylate kinase